MIVVVAIAILIRDAVGKAIFLALTRVKLWGSIDDLLLVRRDLEAPTQVRCRPFGLKVAHDQLIVCGAGGWLVIIKHGELALFAALRSVAVVNRLGRDLD